jgi:type III restriction enzyme
MSLERADKPARLGCLPSRRLSFYPDFLCQLNDDRVLVVEYKGEHLFAEAEEKRSVGAVWESRSNGKCLFVMPEGKDLEKIRAAIKSS